MREPPSGREKYCPIDPEVSIAKTADFSVIDPNKQSLGLTLAKISLAFYMVLSKIKQSYIFWRLSSLISLKKGATVFNRLIWSLVKVTFSSIYISSSVVKKVI